MMLSKLLKNRLVVRGLWMAAFVLVWALGAGHSGISPMLLPSPKDVAVVLWDSLSNGDLLYQSAYSLWIIVIGLLIGIVLAFALALVSLRFKTVSGLVDTVTAIAHPLPGIAILPLVMIWFGTGTGAITALIVHSCLWPMLINLLAGFRATPAIYTDVGRNLSVGPLAAVFEILIPSSMSYLLSGAKIGWARAWRALISAEMVFGAIGAKGGIGWYIFKQRTFMNTAGLFAGIIVVIAIGMLMEDLVFAQLEKRTVIKWGMARELR